MGCDCSIRNFRLHLKDTPYLLGLGTTVSTAQFIGL